MRGALIRVEKLAGVGSKGKCNKLRHTFCSRLAMANVPMLTIQALAGHESIEAAQRYMRLSQAAPHDAIRRLDARLRGRRGGDKAGGGRKREGIRDVK